MYLNPLLSVEYGRLSFGDMELARKREAGPAKEFLVQGDDEIRAILSGQQGIDGVTLRFQEVPEEAVGAAQGLELHGIDRNGLARDRGNDFVADVDCVEAEDAPAVGAFFGAVEKTGVGRQRAFDSVDLDGKVDDGGHGGDGAGGVERDQDWTQAMLGGDASLGHVDGAGDEVSAVATKPADADLGIGPETGAHAFPESEVAAFAFANDELGDGGDVGAFD